LLIANILYWKYLKEKELSKRFNFIRIIERQPYFKIKAYKLSYLLMILNNKVASRKILLEII